MRKKKVFLTGAIWDAAAEPRTLRQIAEMVGKPAAKVSPRVSEMQRKGMLVPAGEVMVTGPSGRTRPVPTYGQAPGSTRPIDMTGAHLKERNKRVIQGAALAGRMRVEEIDESIDPEAEMAREAFEEWRRLEETMPRTPPPIPPLAQALGA